MKKLEEFITRNIAGEYVMMPFGSTAQKFSGLIIANDVSNFIWEHIEDIDTEEELAHLIYEEYEVSYEEALRDVTNIISEMRTAGWIE